MSLAGGAIAATFHGLAPATLSCGTGLSRPADGGAAADWVGGTRACVSATPTEGAAGIALVASRTDAMLGGRGSSTREPVGPSSGKVSCAAATITRAAATLMNNGRLNFASLAPASLGSGAGSL